MDDKKQHVCPGSWRPGDLRTSLHAESPLLPSLRRAAATVTVRPQPLAVPQLDGACTSTRQRRVRCRDQGCSQAQSAWTSRRRSTGQPAPRAAWRGDNLEKYSQLQSDTLVKLLKPPTTLLKFSLLNKWLEFWTQHYQITWIFWACDGVQVPEQLQPVRHGRGAAGGGRPVRLLAGGRAAGEKIFV